MSIYTTYVAILISTLAIVGCCRFPKSTDDVVLRRDITQLTGCPDALVDIRDVYLADFILFNFKQHLVPLPGSPSDAAFRVHEVVQFFLKPIESFKLPFTLGESLQNETPDYANVALLQPLYLIAVDRTDQYWLLEVRRQDSAIHIYTLQPATQHPSYDNLYWSDEESPWYSAHDTRLHDYFSKQLKVGYSEHAPPAGRGEAPRP